MERKKKSMEKLLKQNIAFFDSEFTSNSLKDRGIQELIQCALIICTVTSTDDNKPIEISEPIFEYKTFVKTNYNKELSDYIKGLTGITERDVSSGESFNSVMEMLKQIVEEYEVKTIVVWGPDQMLLRHNCTLNGYEKKKMKKTFDKFKDVSVKISKAYGYKCSTSQKQICEDLKLKMDGQAHDAYYDALNLSKMISKIIEIKQTNV